MGAQQRAVSFKNYSGLGVGADMPAFQLVYQLIKIARRDTYKYVQLLSAN